jgi:hypothetical protein
MRRQLAFFGSNLLWGKRAVASDISYGSISRQDGIGVTFYYTSDSDGQLFLEAG